MIKYDSLQIIINRSTERDVRGEAIYPSSTSESPQKLLGRNGCVSFHFKFSIHGGPFNPRLLYRGLC